MANQSKAAGQPEQLSLIMNILQSLTKTNQRKMITLSAVITTLYLGKQRFGWGKDEQLSPRTKTRLQRKRQRGYVNKEFFQKLKKLLKIVFPTIYDTQILNLILLTIALFLRTYLSIYLAGVNGDVVKSIVALDLQKFTKKIFYLGLVSLPASFVNSSLDFLNKSLAVSIRGKLSNYFNSQYLNDMVYYQLTNLDSRVGNPDQRMTSDIEKWSSSLSLIYSNFTKPILDIILFTRKLTASIGWQAPAIVFLWYGFSGFIMKLVTPAFGKLAAISQTLEGNYRTCHTDLQHHAEEIAFYNGREWESNRIQDSFNKLIKHNRVVMQQRLFMGAFDGMLVKYGAVLVGYTILGFPVFGPGSEAYLKEINGDESRITRDYVSNSSLLINFSKAIGRLVISYKEIQQLAGYTSLVSDMREVLQDLNNGCYERQLIEGGQNYGVQSADRDHTLIQFSQGKVEEVEDYIEFDKLPIVTPNGDKLVIDMDITIKRGMNVVISGPNGCGKSSLFRILGGLWPILGGTLKRPSMDKLFYIPQKPYLPLGTFRDQIIYPHSKLQMMRRGFNDEKLKKFLEWVKLGNLLEKEGNNFDATKEWNNVLAVGEKQRLAMARLFYHQPLFAILDECTSSVSLDIEAILYTKAKELNITLFTVSHRTSLFKYHEYMLKFDGQGHWALEENQSQ